MDLRPLARVFVACAVLAGCAHAPPAGVDFEPELRRLATELTIPGMAFAIVRDGEIERSGGIVAAGAPAFGTDTPLRFASVTKAFSAVLLMRAVEQGRLALDDSASKWLPELAGNPEITVRHLAAHVSEGV